MLDMLSRLLTCILTHTHTHTRTHTHPKTHPHPHPHPQAYMHKDLHPVITQAELIGIHQAVTPISSFPVLSWWLIVCEVNWIQLSSEVKRKKNNLRCTFQTFNFNRFHPPLPSSSTLCCRLFPFKF